MNYDKHNRKLAMDGGRPVRSADRFLVFGAPIIGQAEIDEVVNCLKSGWIGTGPRANAFEKKFAAYKGARHALAVNSCTAALHLSLLASGLGQGDEVLTTPMTFCATINAIIHGGATPVLVDCDPVTMNIDPNQLEAKITSKTKAIVVVHFAGRSCDMSAINAIAKKHDLIVIEDCAHAIETEYHGQKAGCMGDLGCFSFYVTKNIVTGEGGMVITDDAQYASRIKCAALHGMSKDAWKRFSDEGYKHYQVVDIGFKYNMMDLVASLGLHQMDRVEEYWQRRQAIWQRYQSAFADLPCQLPAEVEAGTRHAYHLYTPLLDTENLRLSRDDVLTALTAENIGTGVHYLPIHYHPKYQELFGWAYGDYPHAERVGERSVSLPLSPSLTDGDVEDVITAFRKVLMDS